MDLTDNELLGSLPVHEQKLIGRHLERVSLTTRQEVSTVGSPLVYLHFPINAALSLLECQPSGRSVEVAVVGKEGCTSFYAYSGLTVSPCHVTVQVGGLAFRLNVSDLQPLLPKIPLFIKAVRRFGMVVVRHAFISVACSQFHSVEQRLARWLLAHWHRTGLKEFPFTHEFLADQLGVQRVTVTEALSPLQTKGLLTYGYGKITILDRPALKKAACPCFDLATEAINQYLHDIKTDAQD